MIDPPQNISEQYSIHDEWVAEARRLSVPRLYFGNMEAFLAEMQEHHRGTYEHSMRVGLLAPRIGGLIPELHGLSAKASFYAGTMHDRGKLNTPQELLNKTTNWTAEDAEALASHPLDSHAELLREGMFLTAGAVILHHTFQPNPYPAEIPQPYTNLPKHLVRLQPLLGRVIALADFFDASHRKDSGGSLTKEQIKTKVYEANTDLTELIDKLYDQGIFS